MTTNRPNANQKDGGSCGCGHDAAAGSQARSAQEPKRQNAGEFEVPGRPDISSDTPRKPAQGPGGNEPKDDREEMREVQEVRSGPDAGARSRRGAGAAAE